MAAEFSIEAVGLSELAGDLAKAGPLSLTLGRQAAEITGRKVRDDARQFASGIGHAPHYPRSIQSEARHPFAGALVEIGPQVGGPQWGLGDVLEWGTPNSAPHTHMGPAMDRNTPDFELGIGLAAQQSLR